MNTGSQSGRQAARADFDISLIERRFGANLRALRLAAGMGQRALAEAASGPWKNISKAEITRLESGKQTWRVLHALVLAQALGCKPGQIVDIEGMSDVTFDDLDGKPITEREAALIRHLRDGNYEAALMVMSTLVASSG